MKSYLSLIPISSKIHKRENRLTIMCITCSVFLVTAIFSMAEMGVRMEYENLASTHVDFNIDYLLKNSSTVQSLFSVAIFLFLLVSIASILMISSSINSTVLRRIKFFGMMSCIGMSKKQIKTFVRLEALNWCKIGIPIGLVLGILCTWVLCGILKYFVGFEFSTIPMFKISYIGIISGIVLGVVTVLISSNSPAKKASKISPITAVNTNSSNLENKSKSINNRLLKIETALGVNHATSGKKNMWLMSGSFALSIILFLSFSVLIDFVEHLVPQFSNSYNLSISSEDGDNSVDRNLISKLEKINGVEKVFARRSLFDIPTKLGKNLDINSKSDLISYGNFDLECLEEDDLLEKGSDLSKMFTDRNYVLVISDDKNNVNIGDKVYLDGKDFEIAGRLKLNPFSQDGASDGKVTFIASDKVFKNITGMSDYSLVMIKTSREFSEKDILSIENLLNNRYVFNDMRDQDTSATFFAFKLFIYGFLAVIIVVSVLNIMNSISMSVSARMNQYGSMRAIGVSNKQIVRMISSEAFTYSLCGCVLGCVIGLPISKFIYDFLISSHFAYAKWTLPINSLVFIFLFVVGASVLAVYYPIKRICNTDIRDTINEL